RGRRDVDRGDRWRRRRWWRRRWRRRRRHRDGRGAVLPFARRGDRRRAGRLAGYEPRRVHRRGRRFAARTGDRAPGGRVAARVLRGRGELHGLIHLDRRRGRRDVDRGDRWGRRRRWWRWWRWWRRGGERGGGREGVGGASCRERGGGRRGARRRGGY